MRNLCRVGGRSGGVRCPLGNHRQPFGMTRPVPFLKRSECLLRIPRAEKESLDEGADNAVKTQIDEEGRLEAIEASMRAKRGSAKKTNERVSEMSTSSNSGGMAEWKEGSLFPEGWDDMNPLQKITELYMGKRGFLFWSTKLSLAGVITLAVAWIAFRFIGPALGLYTLTNDLSTPSF